MYKENIILFILINIPIIFFYDKLVKYINLYDTPDNYRKLHKKPVPLVGGILIIYNLSIFFFLDYFFNINPYSYYSDTRETFVFFGGIIGCFLIGLYDDKYNLAATKKLVLNIFLILFLILIDDNLLVSDLFFSFNTNSIELRNFTYPFTILCMLLLLNALNMFDGVNLQVGVYCILIFILLSINKLYIFLNLILILSLILFLFYNYLEKGYLGSSGTQILGFIIAYVLIKSHNTNSNITPDQIFVILSFPGLDMFRLFLFRIINGIHPFRADRNHMHHLISKKLGSMLGFFIIQGAIIINFLLYYFLPNKIISIICIVLLYTLLLLIFKREKNKF